MTSRSPVRSPGLTPQRIARGPARRAAALPAGLELLHGLDEACRQRAGQPVGQPPGQETGPGAAARRGRAPRKAGPELPDLPDLPDLAAPDFADPGSADPDVSVPGVAVPGVAVRGVAVRGVAARGVAGQGVAAPGVKPPVAPSAPGLLDRLAHSAAEPDPRLLFDQVHRMREAGAAPEHLCTVLLAAIARRLGDWWLEDRLDIAGVTLGALRLHRLLNELAPHFAGPSAAGGQAPDRHPSGRPGPRFVQAPHGRALLLPVPGEQHSFGLRMVTELFRASGWPVRNLVTPSLAGLRSVLRQTRFAMIGLSISGHRHADMLAACVRCIRQDARNRDCVVMIGGQLLATDPSLIAHLPVDLLCVDGASAPAQAARLLRERRGLLRSSVLAGPHPGKTARAGLLGPPGKAASRIAAA